MKRSTVALGLVVGFVLLGMLGAFALVLGLAFRKEGGGDLAELGLGKKVAVVELTGVILESRDLIEDLRRHEENSSVKAIVLRIDSPGGAVAPSQEIYEEVLRLRTEKKKPVVVSMGSLAASGGYYVASAAKEIYANPGSVTGSIGVIMQWTNYGDLLRWAKLKPETITSGPMKDVGNPTREMTPEERQYFQDIIDELRDQFVEDVAEGRKGKLTVEQVDVLADGRVFTGTAAKEKGLVDELGNLEDAIDRAAELGGISGDPVVVYPREREPGFFDLFGESLFGKGFAAALRPALQPVAGGGYRFYYLW
jgi:protease IV